MIDIYMQNKKCPICDGRVKFDVESMATNCVNGCYTFGYNEVSGSDVSIIVNLDGNKGYFNLVKRDGETKYRKQETQIRERIEYWKENDRYLIKIISD
ncbi:MAG: hypothetical protein K0R18_497 [Bacillales bacterium]|jgi:hypothetical protein|nr:hypothetical protein [Bacillales bacterium]